MKKLIILAIAFLAQPAAADAAVRNYFAPQRDGQFLDACLSNGGACGKPVADAFCQAEGFEKAILFQREPRNLTLRFDSAARCEGKSCMSFRQIKCFTTKADFAGLQQVAE